MCLFATAVGAISPSPHLPCSGFRRAGDDQGLPRQIAYQSGVLVDRLQQLRVVTVALEFGVPALAEAHAQFGDLRLQESTLVLAILARLRIHRWLSQGAQTYARTPVKASQLPRLRALAPRRTVRCDHPVAFRATAVASDRLGRPAQPAGGELFRAGHHRGHAAIAWQPRIRHAAHVGDGGAEDARAEGVHALGR